MGITFKCHFSPNPQVGVPKLGLLLSQNFGRSYLFQIKFFFKNVKAKSYSLQKNLSKGVYHAPIGAHLTPAFKGLVVKSQIPNLTPAPFFDHNSCKSTLNEKCEGALNI